MTKQKWYTWNGGQTPQGVKAVLLKGGYLLEVGLYAFIWMEGTNLCVAYTLDEPPTIELG